MTHYEIVTKAIITLRNRKGKQVSFNIVGFSENKKDSLINLVCCTNDGIAPYLVFEVKIPLDDFSPSRQQIDIDASIKGKALSQENIFMLRVAYRIVQAYKEAKKQIANA